MKTHDRGARRLGRRGVALFAALVVVTIGALVATGVMFFADAQMTASQSSLRRMQSRALAWSGVQIVMAELGKQRQELLDGKKPVLTERYSLTIPGAGGPVRVLIRLVEVTPGELAVSEPSKLNVNHATAEMLAKLPGVNDALAGAIIAARPAGGFSSPEDLAGVEGITPELLSGLSRVAGDDAAAGAGVGGAQNAGAGETPAGLIDLLTVLSFDPNVQLGIGSDEGVRGALRIDLNVPWSDRLGAALDERFGRGTSAAVKELFDRGTTFKKPSDMVKVLRRMNIPADSWAAPLDALTTERSAFLAGRVDLNTASESVLACVPGIDAIKASRIVRERASVPDEDRRSVTWPVRREMLTADEFELAVDHLTTRSMQWRVRVEAGFVQGEGGGADESEGEEPVIADRVMYEAVIDVASERARVAYLRDVTLLAAARAIESARAGDEQGPDEFGGAPREGARAGGGAGAVEWVDEAGESALVDGPPLSGVEPQPERVDEARENDDELKASGESGVGASPAAERGDDEELPDPRIGRWTPGVAPSRKP